MTQLGKENIILLDTCLTILKIIVFAFVSRYADKIWGFVLTNKKMFTHSFLWMMPTLLDCISWIRLIQADVRRGS